MSKFHILTVANPKTIQGEASGWLTAILHMAPAMLSGHNVCPFSTAACRAACLNLAGRGGVGGPDNKIQRARIRKTKWFFRDRPGFVAALGSEIRKLAVLASVMGMRPAVRLNGTSDILWERVAPELFTRFEGIVQFYDYTKAGPGVRKSLPKGYDLTYSRSDGKDAVAVSLLGMGGKVAVVFDTPKGQPLPKEWHGYPVFDGDVNDLRFLDPKGHVIGVRAKGPAKKDRTGFVVRVQQ